MLSMQEKRAELVERLRNSGLSEAQAENVAGAVCAYGDLDSALEAIRRG